MAQIGWREGKDNTETFIKYILGIIISAYRDLEELVELVSENLPAIDMVRKTIESQIGKITKSQICQLYPSLNASSVEVALRKMVGNGELIKHGAGRSTFYVRTN